MDRSNQSKKRLDRWLGFGAALLLSGAANAATLPSGWTDQQNGLTVTYSAARAPTPKDEPAVRVHIQNLTGAAQPYVLFLSAQQSAGVGGRASLAVDESFISGTPISVGVGFHLLNASGAYIGESAGAAQSLKTSNALTSAAYNVVSPAAYVVPRITIYTVPVGAHVAFNVGLHSFAIAAATPAPTPKPTPTPTPKPTATPQPTPTATPVASAYYVSPSGNDNNSGGLQAPFATLARAQKAMQSSSIKTVYLRAGTYKPALSGMYGAALDIFTADAGETWSYYPADGVNSAVIDGGSTTASNGAFAIFHLSGDSNVTFNGIKMQNFQYAAVWGEGGGNNLTVKNCEMANGTSPFENGNPGAVSLYGTQHATISNNYIHDMAGPAIDVGNVNGTINNLLISNNFVLHTCTASSDCGAIYVIDSLATATNMQILNNYVRDGNVYATLSSGAGSAIYLDDCTSNVTASGNILAGRNGTNTVHIHGGSNDHFSGNLTDLSTYQQNIMNIQTSDLSGCSNHAMSNDTYQSNIIISTNGGGGFGDLSGTSLNKPQISNNAYHSYGSAQILTHDDYADTNPVSEDPLLAGWAYSVSSSSPVYSAPVSFAKLPTSWGPVGFAVPTSGSTPSNPH